MTDSKQVIKLGDFPSNSDRSKMEKKREEPRVKKVVTGNVTKRKKSFGQSLLSTFVSEDVDNVGAYLLEEVLIPGAQSILYDMFHGGIDMVFGRGRGSYRGRSRRDDRSYVSYDKASYRDRDRDYDRGRDKERERRNRSKHNFDDYVIKNRSEAEEILDCLIDFTIDYQRATVYDLYDMIGVTREYTDKNWGWTSLRGARVVPVRGGYIFDLPRPILLD